MIRLRKEKDVVEELEKQRRPYQYSNPSPEQAKEAEHNKIDIERFSTMQYMTFMVPSLGKEVKINITEDPPIKPRLTWLTIACLRMLAYVQEGKNTEIGILVDADDVEHSLTAPDWVALLKELGGFLQANIEAAAKRKQKGKKLNGKKRYWHLLLD